MTFVYVWTPPVSGVLVGGGTPQNVQITIDDIPAGEAFLIEGVAGDYVWQVRAGAGVSDGSAIVRGDNRSPINVPYFYRVTWGDTVWLSQDVTVSYPTKYAFQSLSGRSTAFVKWMDNGLPMAPEVRYSAFAVPGRRRPVIRTDGATAGGGQLVLDTGGTQTAALLSLLSTGRPLVVRTDGDVRDFPTVEILLVTNVESELTGAGIQDEDTRRWSLSYLLVDDPEPNTPLALSTWNDFDDVYAGLTWADFDEQWAGSTWSVFDRFDWEGQA